MDPGGLLYREEDYFHVDSDQSELIGRARSRRPDPSLFVSDPPSAVSDVQLTVISINDSGSGIPSPNSQLPGPGPNEHRNACHENHRRVPVDRTARNQLVIASVLTTLFMVSEIVGGVLSNSLALAADAAHMASDLTGFLVSLFAVWLATKAPTARLTFGYHRAEIIGAALSILIIWIVTGILVYLGAKRLITNEYNINPDTMLITAGIGVAFNIVMALVLHGGIYKKCRLPQSFGHNHSHGGTSHMNHNHHDNNNHHGNLQSLGISRQNPLMTSEIGQESLENGLCQNDLSCHRPNNETSTYNRNINIRAANLHVLGDLIQSVGVFIAAVIIKVKPEYKMADPICTFIFSVLVLITTLAILRDIVSVIMEAVPKDADIGAMKKELAAIEGVRSVHSFHLWALTINKTAVTMHLAVVRESVVCQEILNKARDILRTKFHVMYSTIQIETYDDCMSMCVDCNR